MAVRHEWMRKGRKDNKPLPTQGYKVGYFGVFKIAPRCWGVTHLPTGLGLHLLEGRTKQAAIKACEAAQKLDMDWSIADTQRIYALFRTKPQILDKLRALHRSSNSTHYR